LIQVSSPENGFYVRNLRQFADANPSRALPLSDGKNFIHCLRIAPRLIEFWHSTCTMGRKHKRPGVQGNASSASSGNESVIAKKGRFQDVDTEVPQRPVSEDITDRIDSDLNKQQLRDSDLRNSLMSMERIIIETREETRELAGRVFELQCENERLRKEADYSKKEREKLKEKMFEIEQRQRRTTSRLNDLEQYGRRWNLRIWGIEGDSKNETTEESMRKVVQFIRERLEIHDVHEESIEIAHRLGTYRLRENRAMIVRFMTRPDRQRVLNQRRRLRGSQFKIVEDLTPDNHRLLQRWKNALGFSSAWSWNGNIFVSLRSGRIQRVHENTATRDLVDDANPSSGQPTARKALPPRRQDRDVRAKTTGLPPAFQSRSSAHPRTTGEAPAARGGEATAGTAGPTQMSPKSPTTSEHEGTADKSRQLPGPQHQLQC